ncbi:MAG: nitrate reductase [Planctomycetota bacterium]|nr:nitrate reductase [Planctomycetota bacterium]
MSAPRSGEAMCPYCGVGCRTRVEAEGNRIVRVRGVADAPANRGRICPKGATLGKVVDTPDRLRTPLVRNGRDEAFRPCSWQDAVELAARKLNEIRERFGPDSIAFYGSGQLDTETSYLACKLFKGSLGTNNTDSNSRLCMASAAVAYTAALGSDGPPTCYDDIQHARTIVVSGSNMADAHPVTFDAVRQRKREDPALRLVVIDPRRTKTAECADLHLPLRCGSDLALFHALSKLVLPRMDRAFVEAHTQGSEDYLRFLHAMDLDALIAETGLAKALVERAAEWLDGAFLTFYSMGANQSTEGVRKNLAIINMHLLLGQIGKPGAGPFSLTGQPNAMGGREAGLLAHQLPGYRMLNEPAHRREAEALWNLPDGAISDRPGLTAVEMFQALESGRLKAVWIAATNPAASLPDLNQVKRAFGAAPFVIVQDAYHPTETTVHADLLLPAAQWSEKEWTGTNSERMVSFSERIVDPVGEAEPDYEILCRVARAMGLSGFDFQDRAAIWDEFRRYTAGRPCEMTGMDAERLKRERMLQWPCPAPEHPGTLRRYTDGRFATPSGRAHFHLTPAQGPRDEISAAFPLILTTGRLAAHWHTRTRTGKVPSLNNVASKPTLQLHPDDAAARGIVEGDLVEVFNERGRIDLPAEITHAVPPGTVFGTFHWGDLFAPARNINYLTTSAFDPVSKQPEFKHAAVEVVRKAVQKLAFHAPRRAEMGEPIPTS